MSAVMRYMMIGGSALMTAFGIMHLFWPEIFKWREQYRKIPDVFSDTIRTMNFYMCMQIIVIGLAGIAAPVMWRDEKRLIIMVLFIQSTLVLLRLLYGIVKPIRIPGRYSHFLFLLLLALVLVLCAVPLAVLIVYG